jgi:hypothetical protein
VPSRMARHIPSFGAVSARVAGSFVTLSLHGASFVPRRQRV